MLDIAFLAERGHLILTPGYEHLAPKGLFHTAS